MKFDWTKWSAVAEILSAVAIVFTLLYLAVQTRYVADQTEQNNELLRAQAGYNLLQNRAEFRSRVISDPELAEFWVQTGLYGDASALDLMVRFRNERNILNWQWEWRQWLDGNLAFGEFSVPLLREVMAGQQQSEFRITETWEMFKSQLDPDFVEWLESEVMPD